MDYTIYDNWYKYMSSVLNQIRGISDYPSSTGRASSTGQSFADIYNAIMGLDTVQDTKAAENISFIETGSTSMDAIFEEAANLYDVPLNLLKAMGKAESGFDANAVSPAGAQGVMQLMPATARSLGVEDPFDARSNIMGGAKYISQQLKKYNGNIDLALAAYNASSGITERMEYPVMVHILQECRLGRRTVLLRTVHITCLRRMHSTLLR